MRMLVGVGAAPSGSFWRKMSKTSQLRNLLLRIVSPSTAQTWRHSTCASEPGVTVKSWKSTPSMRMFRGGAEVAGPLEAMRLFSFADGPTLPPMKEMSCEDWVPLGVEVEVLQDVVAEGDVGGAGFDPQFAGQVQAAQLQVTGEDVELGEIVTVAPAAGWKTTSAEEVFDESSESEVSE